LPFTAVVFELTVSIAVPVWPGARTSGVTSRTEGVLKFVPGGVSLSLTHAGVKVLELHAEVSAFFTFTVYSTFPPAVMAWAEGVTTRIGVFFVHTATSSIVVTLFEVLFAWFALAAVTEEVFVPLVRVAFALTVKLIGALVAPGARITDGELRIEGVSKFVPGGVSLSFTVRLNVSSVQAAPLSLFFTSNVYTALPLSVVIVCHEGLSVTVGARRLQTGGVMLIVVVTVLEESLCA
jgi:hypothetical protein